MSLVNILIVLSLVAVVAVLGLGFYSLQRGGEFARTHSNRLMRLRVLLQAVAIGLLLLSVWLGSRG
ncbi:MAG TPA: twin transmembrane helix small protein [Caulobacteraceae bacterium]